MMTTMLLMTTTMWIELAFHSFCCLATQPPSNGPHSVALPRRPPNQRPIQRRSFRESSCGYLHSSHLRPSLSLCLSLHPSASVRLSDCLYLIGCIIFIWRRRQIIACPPHIIRRRRVNRETGWKDAACLKMMLLVNQGAGKGGNRQADWQTEEDRTRRRKREGSR